MMQKFVWKMAALFNIILFFCLISNFRSLYNFFNFYKKNIISIYLQIIIIVDSLVPIFTKVSPSKLKKRENAVSLSRALFSDEKGLV